MQLSHPEQQHALVRTVLLDCGMRAVAEHGTDSDVIAPVLALSGLSPETLHEHFHDAGELVQAVAVGLSNELIGMIEGAAGDLVDPARRIACGIRIYLQTASDCPLFAQFVAKAGLGVVGPRSLLHEYLPAHIASGTRSARFSCASTASATDLVAGMTIAAVARIASGATPEGYAQDVVTAILRGLGVPGMQARRLANIEPPHIEPRANSLLARARATH